MFITPAIAAGTKLSVVRHIFGADNTAEVPTGGFPHITILPRSKNAATSHVTPGECGIMLGRNIPVVRHLEIETPILPVANGGKQQSAIALVRNGKTESRHIGDGHPVKLHLQVLSRTYSRRMVEGNFTGFDQY